MNLLLPNPDFLKWFLGAISKVRKSIVVVNYMATLKEGEKGAVAKIASALAAAVKRGVKVEAVLEGSKLGENYLFWKTLKDAGADCWMDTSATFIHTKAILIDDKTLCIGSHNITAAALVYHEEISLTTTDADAIRRFKKELLRYTEQRRTIGEAPKEGVLLPATVMEPLVKIKRSAAFRAYSLYLLLCRVDKGTPKTIPIDIESWVKTLKLPTFEWGANARVNSLLEFMDKKLRVVRLDKKKGTVQRAALRRSADRILLPKAFWDYGWNLRLPVEAIHFYLAGENERLTSPNSPWWRLKRDQIAARYGFQKQLVGRAQRELTRYDLLEVLYETTTSAYQKYVRYMNYYRQNPFYDYEKRADEIAALKGRYEKPVFEIATGIMRKLSIDSDAKRLEVLCRYIAEAGVGKGREVQKKILKLKSLSWRLKFDYVEELFGRTRFGEQ